MFGPLAAIGHGRSGFCELRSRAVDNPGAGRIEALNPGEIEDHALRALRLRDQRCGARLQPVAARDNPLARQRQDNPVAAGFFGYGRRSRHQALRPSRNGAHIARPGYCRGQFQGVARAGDQGKNKPSTNRRPRDRELRFADKASRIFHADRRTEPSGLSLRRLLAPFPAPQSSGSSFCRAGKASANQSVAESPSMGRQSRAGLSHAPAGVKSGWRNLARPAGALPRSGTRAKGPGTNGAGIGDAANARDSSRQRQSGFRAPGGRDNVMVAKGLSAHCALSI